MLMVVVVVEWDFPHIYLNYNAIGLLTFKGWWWFSGSTSYPSTSPYLSELHQGVNDG